MAITKLGKKLTTEERSKLPTQVFALPQKRKYPIHDEAHARSALVYISRYGTPQQKAQVRKAVYSKYPDMKKTSGILQKLKPLKNSIDDYVVQGLKGGIKPLNKAEAAALKEHNSAVAKYWLHNSEDATKQFSTNLQNELKKKYKLKNFYQTSNDKKVGDFQKSLVRSLVYTSPLTTATGMAPLFKKKKDK